MAKLLFFRKSCAYRHAAREQLATALALPSGTERTQARKRARALLDLAREEAWLEGQVPAAPLRRAARR
jgi:hypothetical protein